MKYIYIFLLILSVIGKILNDKSIQPNLFNQSLNNLLCDIDLDENQVNEANLEMEIPQYNVNFFFILLENIRSYYYSFFK